MKNTARKRRPTEDARPELRTVLAEAAAETRLQLQLELGDAMRRDLREFVIAAGTAALAAVLEDERTRAVGPRYAHLPARRARRTGSAPGELVMGGRRVQVRRPRARTLAGEEIQLPSWTTFASEDPLHERAVNRCSSACRHGATRGRLSRSPRPCPSAARVGAQ